MASVWFIHEKIKHLVIHCTATPQAVIIPSIQHCWRECLLWNNPGFHYIIYPDGRIVHLPDVKKNSDAVINFNHESVHIAYIGGIDDKGTAIDNRTEFQKDAILKLLSELKKQFPEANILGYRDFLSESNNINEVWSAVKESPCFNTISEYAHL